MSFDFAAPGALSCDAAEEQGAPTFTFQAGPVPAVASAGQRAAEPAVRRPADGDHAPPPARLKTQHPPPSRWAGGPTKPLPWKVVGGRQPSRDSPPPPLSDGELERCSRGPEDARSENVAKKKKSTDGGDHDHDHGRALANDTDQQSLAEPSRADAGDATMLQEQMELAKAIRSLRSGLRDLHEKTRDLQVRSVLVSNKALSVRAEVALGADPEEVLRHDGHLDDDGSMSLAGSAVKQEKPEPPLSEE